MQPVRSDQVAVVHENRIPKDVSITDYVEDHYDEIGAYVVIDDNRIFSDMRCQVQTTQVFTGDDLEQALAILG